MEFADFKSVAKELAAEQAILDPRNETIWKILFESKSEF